MQRINESCNQNVESQEQSRSIAISPKTTHHPGPRTPRLPLQHLARTFPRNLSPERHRRGSERLQDEQCEDRRQVEAEERRDDLAEQVEVRVADGDERPCDGAVRRRWEPS